MCTTYKVWPRKNEDGAKIIMVKKSPWCNNVQLNKVQLLIETSSDKLQNVSQSVSVSSFEAVCLTTVKC